MGVAVQSAQYSRPRVLMAGVDRINLSHVSLLLGKSGYDLVMANDGEQALKILQSEDPPPLAILEWSMPGVSGIDICRQIRQSQRRRYTYVILLTHWNQKVDNVLGLEAGADDCVYKPVDVRELRLRLQIGAQIILERALQDSEERFRTAFQYAGIGMAAITIGGRFMEGNSALCTFLGRPPEELIGLRLRDVCHPDDQPSCENLLGDLLQSGQRSREFERRFVAKDGGILWAALTVAVVLDTEENASSFVVQIQDISERKRAEHALKESLEQSQKLVKELADERYALDQHAIVASTDVAGRISYVNDKFCAISKFSREELMGKDHRIINSGYHPPEFFQDMYQNISRGMVWKGEIRNRAKDGSIYWVDTTIVPYVGPNGKPFKYVAIRADITERKVNEEALRRSESLFLAISNGAEDIISVRDTQMRWLHTGASVRTILGYDPASLLGKDSTWLLHPDDIAPVQAAYSAIQTDSQPKTVVVRYRHKDGHWLTFEASISPLRNAQGEPDGYVIIARVIEDRLLAERKLKAAHAETELFLRSIPSIVIGLDSEGRITRWNLTAAKRFGLEESGVLGRPLQDCGVRWLHPDMKVELARWLATEDSLKCEDLGWELEGRSRFLNLQIRRIPGEAGERPRYIVTGDDVTRRRHLEEQLRQAQKLEAIGQLAAGIAHEINTPTQYVSDNTRFLKDSWDSISKFLNFCDTVQKQAEQGPVPPEMLREFAKLYSECDFEYLLKEIPRALDQSLDGLQRVGHIVHGMKEFSHPGTKEKRAVNINKAIETTVTVSRHEWKYCANVLTELDETLPLIPCLVGEFNQAILNIIVNAAHAIGSALGENVEAKGTIRIVTRRDGPWVLISIADDGGGIPKDIQARVFEPFFTTKDVGKGTGQGLALAHSVIVNRHEGQIWFESDPGKGTTFFIRMPIDIGLPTT